TEGAEGIYRFLGRVYRFVTRNAPVRQTAPADGTPGLVQMAKVLELNRLELQELIAQATAGEADRQALRKLHQTLKKITEDFESRWHFNTCIASVMELVNE